jgi:hypothetical protein
MAWAFDEQLSREAKEQSVRRVMNYQSQEGIALDGFGGAEVRGTGLRHGGGERRNSLRVRLPWRESDQ